MLFRLLEGSAALKDHEKTDVFRRDVPYSREFEPKLREARAAGAGKDAQALDAVRTELGDIGCAQPGVVIDLFLSYRDVKAFDKMLDLYREMDPVLKNTRLAREQHPFALNRAGLDEETEAVLAELIETRGPSSETCGLLGRVYKDRWQAAKKAGDGSAPGWADKAIGAYLKGLETEWRDAYPGVNAVTLIALADPQDPRIARLVPVVRYAVGKLERGAEDFWDYATLVELAAVAGDLDHAERTLPETLANLRQSWEAQTTARNLSLFRDALKGAGKDVTRLSTIIAALEGRTKA